MIIFFALNFVSDSSIRQIHDVTDRSYVHLCTFQLLNLFLVCCLLQIFEGKSTYKKISFPVCKKQCSCPTCRRQETHLDSELNIDVQSNDTISTVSSIEQDDSRKNAKLVDYSRIFLKVAKRNKMGKHVLVQITSCR